MLVGTESAAGDAATPLGVLAGGDTAVGGSGGSPRLPRIEARADPIIGDPGAASPAPGEVAEFEASPGGGGRGLRVVGTGGNAGLGLRKEPHDSVRSSEINLNCTLHRGPQLEPGAVEILGQTARSHGRIGEYRHGEGRVVVV